MDKHFAGTKYSKISHPLYVLSRINNVVPDFPSLARDITLSSFTSHRAESIDERS